jgi:hypothetical protein
MRRKKEAKPKSIDGGGEEKHVEQSELVLFFSSDVATKNIARYTFESRSWSDVMGRRAY